MACVDLAVDITLASGLLWQAADLPAALRSLADTLVKRRESEPARELIATVLVGRLRRQIELLAQCRVPFLQGRKRPAAARAIHRPEFFFEEAL
jgi:hypothetical protein